jgi:hypothetical protein
MDFTINGPKINIPERISIRKPLLVIGSCFAENIGALLQEQLFDVKINPFGIVYNPLSIVQQLMCIIRGKKFVADDLFEHNGLWHSWQHHGSFADADQDVVLSNINSQLEEAYLQLKKADWLIITLGSAFYYSLIDGQIVSNCHKVPAAHFKKKIATETSIIIFFEKLFKQLQKINPNIKILFNVSPVRYVRDGLTENTISKSILHLAIHEIIKKNENCFYFPSYEIVIDELRDYRFYDADMLHPNAQAISYIYEKFSCLLFDAETILAIKSIDELNAFIRHRPLHPNREHRIIREAKIDRMKQNLQQQYPFLSSRIS